MRSKTYHPHYGPCSAPRTWSMIPQECWLSSESYISVHFCTQKYDVNIVHILYNSLDGCNDCRLRWMKDLKKIIVQRSAKFVQYLRALWSHMVGDHRLICKIIKEYSSYFVHLPSRSISAYLQTCYYRPLLHVLLFHMASMYIPGNINIHLTQILLYNTIVTKHYWNPVDLMSYSFVNSLTFLVSTEWKCHICDIIVLNKLTLTQSKHISEVILKHGVFHFYIKMIV